MLILASPGNGWIENLPCILMNKRSIRQEKNRDLSAFYSIQIIWDFPGGRNRKCERFIPINILSLPAKIPMTPVMERISWMPKTERKNLDAPLFPGPYYLQVGTVHFSAPLEGRRILH
jgi:hypothetical protein